MTSVRSEYGVGRATVGEDDLLHYNPAEKFNGTSRLIIALHGHSGTSSQLVQDHVSIGRHATALVRTGRYMVLAVGAGGSTAWSNPAAMTSISAGVTYGQSRGAKTGKYGLLGYSMGGLTALNKIKRDAANIAGAQLWAPVTDLTWAHSGVNAGWVTQIEAAHGSWAASVGYRVADEPATYAALSVPVRVVHATDDAVIPYAQTTQFLAAVGGSSAILRQPDVTGGHSGLFQSVPDAETVAFFDSLNWT